MSYERVENDGFDNNRIINENSSDRAAILPNDKKQIFVILRTIILIAINFIPAITLTFFQKWILKDFEFPLLMILTNFTIKFTLAFLLRTVIIFFERNQRIPYSRKLLNGISVVGIASGFDIGLSLWGLKLVHVSLYSMTKSTGIVFLLIFAILLKLEKKAWSQVIIVLMISIGLFMFTYQSQEFNLLGFTLLLIASLNSGVRYTCAQLFMQDVTERVKNPLDMVYLTQPWMFLAVFPIFIICEGQRIWYVISNYEDINKHNFYIASLFIFDQAILAFISEFTEILVIKYTSSLTVSVAGVTKGVFILVLAIIINHDVISMINFVGLLICLSGIGSHIVYKYKLSQESRNDLPPTYVENENYEE